MTIHQSARWTRFIRSFYPRCDFRRTRVCICMLAFVEQMRCLLASDTRTHSVWTIYHRAWHVRIARGGLFPDGHDCLNHLLHACCHGSPFETKYTDYILRRFFLSKGMTRPTTLLAQTTSMLPSLHSCGRLWTFTLVFV